jgi:CBS domain containing-hemolysin-like protein
MASEFAALSNIPLVPGTTCHGPAQVPKSERLDLPALDFMTDFRRITPVTTGKEITIEAALEKMKTVSVRLLLVVDERERVVGLVTSRDIQGEKPIEFAESSGLPRAEILVDHIMTRQPDITALNLLSVRNARVGHIIETLRRLERQHMLVVEVDSERGRQTIRGLFSTSQIAKQLGLQPSAEMPVAHSLAEIVRELG